MTMCSSSLALLLLLLALSTSSVFASGFELNIDCGSDSNYTDEKGRVWVGDTAYTKSGTSLNVSNASSIKHDHVMDTLRVFLNGQKNCYSVPNVPQQQVLVRASFSYVNSKDISSPPRFNLLLGNSNWTEVVTVSDPGLVVSHEATYVVTGGTVDVCVSQTMDGQVPFMSALEIRSMSTDMFKDFNTNTAFVMKHRNFYGGVPGSLVLDSSGRFWESIVPTKPSSIIKATSNTASTSTTDNLPKEVLGQAMTVPNVSSALVLTFTNLPNDNVPVYVTMYFSEVTPQTKRRSFDIYVDDNLSNTNGSVVPRYGQVSNYTMHNISANSTTKVSLNATADSDLPPLLNGYQVYTVISIVQPASSGAPTLTSDTTAAKFLAGFWAIVAMYLWGAI